MNEGGNFFARLFRREDNQPKEVKSEVVDNSDQRLDVLAHRGGMTLASPGNSIAAGKEAFAATDGAEIDLSFTKDGVCVITHKDTSNLTFEEFKEKYPGHATLETWIDWLQMPDMRDKKLYLDLKTTDQDPFKLVELVQKLEGRVHIGSKDTATVVQLLLARKLLGAKCEVYLQIPEPLSGRLAVDYAQRVSEIVGLDKDELARLGVDINDLKPDGIHFFWPNDVLQSLEWEKVGHAQFISEGDTSIPSDDEFFVKWKSNPFFKLIGHNWLGKWMQRKRILGLIRHAKQAGFKVIGGATNTPKEHEQLVEAGVDMIMPNSTRPRHLGEVVRDKAHLPNRSRDESAFFRQTAPKDNFKHTANISKGMGGLRPEEKNTAAYIEAVYQSLTESIKTPSAVKGMLGIA